MSVSHFTILLSHEPFQFEMLQLYHPMSRGKNIAMVFQRFSRYDVGLDKIMSTEEQVTTMQAWAASGGPKHRSQI